MPEPVTLRTERLLLRPWREADRAPFAAMNADPEVRRFFGDLQSRQESDESIDRFQAHLAEHGWTFWAVEVVDGEPFIGFVGIVYVPFEEHFTPAVEIGWRLARDQWGYGYATEAARAVLDFAFGTLGLAEVVSFAVHSNARSRAVMERIGMTHDPAGDFSYPGIPAESDLRRHVLYRIRATDFRDHG